MENTKTKFTTKELTKVALFSALIAVGAFISIPLGAIPITFQNFFVIMAGLLLAPSSAFSSVLIYTLLGLVGLPIFSGFKGGPQYVFMPSFGFIIGFIIGAYVISKLIEKVGMDNPVKIFLVLIVGELIFYAIGLPYMYYVLSSMGKAPSSLMAVLSMGMIPFLPGDIAKMIVATLIAPSIKKAIK